MATRFATTCSYTDVNNAVNGGGPFSGPASDGDIVLVPAGEATWSSQLNINANISLQGAGADLFQAVPSPVTATIIHNGSVNGVLLIFNTNDTDHGGGLYYMAEVTGFVFHFTIACLNSGGAIRMDGFSHGHLSSGIVRGGFRFHHNRWRADTPAIEQNTFLFATCTSGHASGSVDHNYIDYTTAPGSGEVTNFSRRGNVDGSTHGQNVGRDDWGNPYVPGAGLGVNGVYDAIYIEDNIFHKCGGWFDSLSGGGSFVYRYNTSWGAPGTHGLDSGNHLGCHCFEFYNNVFLGGASLPGGNGPTNTNVGRLRGGQWITFNNRFRDAMLGPASMSIQIYRIVSVIGTIIGLGDGTNAFDLNDQGVVTYNGVTVTPIRPGPDPTNSGRAGDIYLEGTINSYTPRVANCTCPSNTYPSGTFVGYAFRDVTTGTDGSDLSQGLSYDQTRNRSATFIQADVRVDATTRNLTLAASTDPPPINMAAGHLYEIRRVKIPFNVSGSGQIGNGWMFNGFSNITGTAHSLFEATPTPSPNPAWCNQAAGGLWNWDNKYSNLGGPWTQMVDLTTVAFDRIPGGIHNWNGAGAPGANIPSGYPSLNNNPKRVGADWNAPGFNEQIPDTDPTPGIIPAASYGGSYPNPYVSGAPPPPPPPVPIKHRKRPRDSYASGM